MVTVQHIKAEGGPAPAGSYSDAVAVGDFVFVSGQGPFDPETGAVIGDNVRVQTDQVITNLETVLRAAGCELSDVVKVTSHLADFDLFDDYDSVYGQRFTAPQPARITIGSGLGGILIEMECIAVRPSS